MFMYDGDHEELSQYRALSRFLPLMDDTFVFVVDDWNWKAVQDGTRKAIDDLQLDVVFEREAKTEGEHESFRDRTGWWNGIFVAVLQKRCLD